MKENKFDVDAKEMNTFVKVYNIINDIIHKDIKEYFVKYYEDDEDFDEDDFGICDWTLTDDNNDLLYDNKVIITFNDEYSNNPMHEMEIPLEDVLNGEWKKWVDEYLA